MKTNTKLHSIAFASLILILFLIIISSEVSGSPVKNAPLTITETRITAVGGVSGYDYEIYGNHIVWGDKRSGQDKPDIYMYEIPTHKETRITNHGSASNPAIFGNNVVWLDRRNGQDKPDIYMYDISTHKETRITNHGSASDPVIYSNNIVWLDGRNGKSQDDNAGGRDVYMYNTSTHKETRITNQTIPPDGFGYSLMVAINGNRIIWGGTYHYNIYDIFTHKVTDISATIINPILYGNRIMGVSDIDGRPSDLVMYDLSTHKETRIITNGSSIGPDIYGNRIVWDEVTEGSFGFGNIYMYDLSNKKKTQITTSGSADYSVVIYGNKIVWQDGRNGNEDIYVYDLSTHQETHTTDKSNQTAPVIFGNRVVWMDDRNGNEDIYMGTLNYLPVAAFSASPASGKAPLTVKFTDKSTNSPTSWSWSFGDKTPNAITKNPAHKYAKAGKYTISLTIKNAAGSNTKKISNYITVK